MLGSTTARVLALPLLGLALCCAAAAPALAAPAPQDAKPEAKAAPAEAPKGLGEPPPALEEVEWVQGKPLKQFKRGEIYLVSFLQAGSPATPFLLRQLNEQQQAHAQDRLVIIGLASRADPRFEPIASFMKRRPDSAGLMIARDKNDANFKAWQNLIGKIGDGEAALVDRKGKIAWHGGVTEDLGAALAAVVADDSAALGKLVEARRTIDASAKTQIEALGKAYGAKQWDKVVAAADALLALDARAFSGYCLAKYHALVNSGKKEAAAAYGREAIAGPLHDDEGQLNELAWWIVDPDGRLSDSSRDNELALLAAERGCELSGQSDAALLDTLARAHWRLGQRDQALELQKKALGLAFGSDMKSSLQKTLDEYLKPPPPATATPAAEVPAAPAPAAPAAPATPPPPGPDAGGGSPKR